MYPRLSRRSWTCRSASSSGVESSSRRRGHAPRKRSAPAGRTGSSAPTRIRSVAATDDKSHGFPSRRSPLELGTREHALDERVRRVEVGKDGETLRRARSAAATNARQSSQVAACAAACASLSSHAAPSLARSSRTRSHSVLMSFPRSPMPSGERFDQLHSRSSEVRLHRVQRDGERLGDVFLRNVLDGRKQEHLRAVRARAGRARPRDARRSDERRRRARRRASRREAPAREPRRRRPRPPSACGGRSAPCWRRR